MWLQQISSDIKHKVTQLEIYKILQSVYLPTQVLLSCIMLTVCLQHSATAYTGPRSQS
jgi:hypothetical protein